MSKLISELRQADEIILDTLMYNFAIRAEWIIGRQHLPTEDMDPPYNFLSQPTTQPTKCHVFHDFRVIWQSPRCCKSLKTIIPLLCHGRGRGFESRRPRHSSKEVQEEWPYLESGFSPTHALCWAVSIHAADYLSNGDS